MAKCVGLPHHGLPHHDLPHQVIVKSNQSRVEAEKTARDMIPLYYAWLENDQGPRQWQQDLKLSKN